MNRKQKGSFGRFLLLWTGEMVSSIGGGLTSFGLSVYVFQATGSAASMALVTLLAFLPGLLLSVPAGVLADRYDRRLLMMLGDGLSGMGILYILFCVMSGYASLLNICIGVTISSVFSSLLEPSYKATITDLLTPEEYAKASGLVGLAGSVRYLVSPVLAGILLSFSDIRLLLIIDALTFVLTVITTGVVRQGLPSKVREDADSMWSSIAQGWAVLKSREGLLLLILVSALITCFMGVLQTLAEPVILAFSNSATLGVTETVCASGMLFSSLYLGMKGIQSGYVRVLSVSLALAGLLMAVFGLKENLILIGAAGFGFFFMLPFANTALDYLARTNIPSSLQGRAWGIIGLISQIGYVVAYACSGILADTAGKVLHIGVGRGAALVVCVSGLLLCLVSVIMGLLPSIRSLEHAADDQPESLNEVLLQDENLLPEGNIEERTL